MWARKYLNKLRFSTETLKLYSIKKQVKDVVKLKGLSENSPYFMIQDKKIELPISSYLANIQENSNESQMAFYDIHYNFYYPSTPVLRLLQQSFYVQTQEQLFFVFANQPIVPSPKAAHFKDTQGSYVLEHIVTDTLKQLKGVEQIDRVTLHNLLMKNVVDSSDEIKIEKTRYKQLLKVVDMKLAIFQESIRIVEEALKIKAQKRVKLFSTVIITQIAFLHYFIYFNLSWDIMEPITVILGNFDLLAAYYFFLVRGQEYSPQTWKNQIVKDKRMKFLNKEGIDTRKYEQLLEIRADLKMRLGLLSKNPFIVMQTVQKPFTLLDSR